MAMILTHCKGFGHRLWSEVRAFGALRFVVHFDADERGAAHGEHTPVCPDCGGRLDLGTMPGPSVGFIHPTS